MQKTKEVARAGKRMGKKVMATDTAQDVVEVLVDGLEEVVVDKADDAGDLLPDGEADGHLGSVVVGGHQIRARRSSAA